MGLSKNIKLFFCTLGLFYLLFGLPIWKSFINKRIIYNDIPVNYLTKLYNERKSPSDLHIVIPVYLRSDVYRFPDIEDAVQMQVNYLLKSTLNPTKPSWSLQIIQLDENEKFEIDVKQNYVITLVLESEIGIILSEDSLETVIFYGNDEVVSNDLPYFIAQTIVEFVFKVEYNRLSSQYDFSFALDIDEFKYHNEIQLSISLLSGDGVPISWEISKALETWFTPLREYLSPLLNFTIDTDVRYYYDDLDLTLLEELISLQHSSNNRNSSSLVKLSELSKEIDLSLQDNKFDQKSLQATNSPIHLAIIFPNNLTVSGKGLTFISNSNMEKINSSELTLLSNSTELIANDALIDMPWDLIEIPNWGLVIVNKYPLVANSLLTEDYLLPIIKLFSDTIFNQLDFNYFVTEYDGSDDIDKPIGGGYMLNYFATGALLRIITTYNLRRSIEKLYEVIILNNKSTLLSRNFKELSLKINDYLNLRFEILDILNDPYRGDTDNWSLALSNSNKMISIVDTLNQEISLEISNSNENLIVQLYYYFILSMPLLTLLLAYRYWNVPQESNSLKAKKIVSTEQKHVTTDAKKI
ncbi:hypothetical protein TBLA_0A06970 [Henningerozyma blattae CBS 6284]|uniref:GPI transamidase component GPI17 n=1 Tax=Henningerozyma blattae (strain ATCC 34711 / CBS 6284 / DSM 70876 / NBRC 10599 / NRRL Y-10934 / UCD 77-7) TaxID=1071380 RepID=I2GWI6_HENB6|nr:hypothetical protein TBLA_0A06970 [Tetrapisispora blattae CBS 6284]CCH58488.1 hypothetical protein TBLA_0A06970 [Tetrapisispora blattae CBS 6284]